MTFLSGWTHNGTVVIVTLFLMAVTGIFLVLLWILRRSRRVRSWLARMKAEKPLIFYGFHILLYLICIFIFFQG